jgi:hypothetical protein
MLRLRRMRTLQKFASVQNHFPTERHLQNRNAYKQTRAAALAEWRGLLAARQPSAGVTETGSHSSDSILSYAIKPNCSMGADGGQAEKVFSELNTALNSDPFRRRSLTPSRLTISLKFQGFDSRTVGSSLNAEGGVKPRAEPQ